jgi:hypothetical protein
VSRFLRDVGTGARGFAQTNVLNRILRTSAGLGVATARVSLPLMSLLRPAAWLVSLVALCAFAIVDPLLNIWRRSWLGMLLSIAV